MKQNIIINLETADPDDVLCLCMISHHPQVNLLGVIVVPGSVQQVNLIKDILCMLDKENVPVGVRSPAHPKSCVSEFHYNWLSDRFHLTEWDHDGLGEDLIHQIMKERPDTKIISGAALSCISKYISKYNGEIERIFAQGGFAGHSVVPEEHQLEKFKGKITCPSFNLGADINAALHIIETQNIKNKYFVSKNVCHGVIYDQEMHERIKPYRHNNPGLELMVNGMEFYLNKKSKGKAFHDPLAACAAIDPSILKWEEVELYREKGGWGSRKVERNGNCSNLFISIAVDKNKFENVLVGNNG